MLKNLIIQIRNFPYFKTLFIFLLLSIISVFFIGCKENSIGFYANIPETLKRGKVASFYGLQARKNCENFRRIYTGLCDTTNYKFITCYDINDLKYKSTECK